MWDLDRDSLVQIIVIVFVMLAGFVQMLFRVLTKPGPKRPEGARRPGPPPKDIREFLKEIRGEGGEPAPGEVPREAPREVPRPAHAERVAGAERTKPRAAADRKPAAPPARPAPQERQETFDEHLVKMALRDRKREEDYGLEDETAAHAPVEARTRVGEGIAARFGSMQAGEEPGARASLVIRRGVTLEDAVIAQTILGPPRAREPAQPRLRARPPRKPAAGT